MRRGTMSVLRQESGYSQDYISEYLGISRPSYRKLESGEASPTVEQIMKLAQLYKVQPETFIYNKIMRYDVEIGKKQKKQVKQEKMRIDVPQENIEKFKQVLLYILSKVGGKPNVGETVLYKLLYFIDMDYYEKYEEQLMGLVYIKNHYGPTPIEFTKVVEEMIQNGEIQKMTNKQFKYDQKKYIALKEADITQLSALEIEHINDELNRLSDQSASQLTEYSHKDVPWIGAEEGHRIDYESVFYRTRDTSVREYEDEVS